MAKPQPVVVLSTAGSRSEAEKIGRLLLKERLIACVNLLSPIRSLYWWNGKVEQGREALLIIKTTRRQLPDIARRIRAAHSYDVPEMIALPVVWGHRPYLSWLEASVRKPKGKRR